MSSLLFNSQSTMAKSCKSFPVLGGEGNEVTKTVNQPSVPIPLPGPASAGLNNNWNTDFPVIPLKKYNEYIIKFTPKSEGTYRVRAYLKYNDGTAKEIYNKETSFPVGKTIEIKGKTGEEQIPYQLNIFVGDTVSFGKVYTISAMGCV
ncbi:MAG TPA: hypothetical protein DCF68_03365 [Cyanothece sp. UBA12306]|nr:hypothetical protein [Cyanothece sp. UBA12306]